MKSSGQTPLLPDSVLPRSTDLHWNPTQWLQNVNSLNYMSNHQVLAETMLICFHQHEQGHIVTLIARLPLSVNNAAVWQLNVRQSPELTILWIPVWILCGVPSHTSRRRPFFISSLHKTHSYGLAIIMWNEQQCHSTQNSNCRKQENCQQPLVTGWFILNEHNSQCVLNYPVRHNYGTP